MSERQSKRVRRILRLIRTNDPERHKQRLPRMAPEPRLIGWQNTTREEYDAARQERK